MEQVNKKDLNFEVNLLPVIAVLAICICFLITVAVWTMVGSVELKQASGSAGILSDRTPIVVVSLSDSKVEVQLKNTSANHLVSWSAKAPTTNENLRRNILGLKAKNQDLKSAIVLSSKSIPYQKIVSTLEILKAQGFTQVGLSSL